VLYIKEEGIKDWDVTNQSKVVLTLSFHPKLAGCKRREVEDEERAKEKIIHAKKS